MKRLKRGLKDYNKSKIVWCKTTRKVGKRRVADIQIKAKEFVTDNANQSRLNKKLHCGGTLASEVSHSSVTATSIHT